MEQLELERISQALIRAIAYLQAGRPVLVADNHDRENEVDAIVAAQTVTQEWMGWLVRYTSGYLCAPMPAERAEALHLPIQWTENLDPYRTCYTVSCDAATGVTTGISAADRRRTLQVLADPNAQATDLVRPGHLLPLRAKPGGVRQRPGHTEAAVELCKLAELFPVAAIGELVFDDGSMMRLSDAQFLAKRYNLPVLTISDLVKYLEWADEEQTVEPLISQQQQYLQSLVARLTGGELASVLERIEINQRISLTATAQMPTKFGDFLIYAFADRLLDAEHIALVSANKSGSLVRIHSECLTGETFGSLRCDCGPQLTSALQQVAQTGGAVVYLRGQEGRGIGLGEKIKAYSLQDKGADTAQANLELGWPVDLREYGAAEGILEYLGLREIRLLTNNPDKTALDPKRVKVVERVPLEVGFDPHNLYYLQTKKELGHLFSTLENHGQLAQK